MSVFDLRVGEIGTILSVAAVGAACERLTALGICRGQSVKVLAFSFFKGSVLVAAGYNRVAIRRAVALGIEVQKYA